jgi:hypothetical protein
VQRNLFTRVEAPKSLFELLRKSFWISVVARGKWADNPILDFHSAAVAVETDTRTPLVGGESSKLNNPKLNFFNATL